MTRHVNFRRLAWPLAGLTLLLLAGWVAFGRGSGAQQPVATNQESRIGSYAITRGGASWRSLTDADGHTVALPGPPTRVVSLTVGTDELLLKLLPVDRIAGLSQLSVDPRYCVDAERAAKLGLAVPSSAEAILDRQPDLVLAASYTAPDTLRALREANAPTLVLPNFQNLDDVKENIRIVGFATGFNQMADELALDIDSQIRESSGRLAEQPGTSQLRALAWEKGTVLAGETLFDSVVRELGATNPASDAGLRGWPKVSTEQSAAWEPDVIFASAGPGTHQATVEHIRDDNLLGKTPAAKAKSVYAIDNAVFYSTSHHIVQLIGTIEQSLSTTLAERAAAGPD